MRYVYFAVTLLLAVTVHAQTRDSVRTEYTTEQTTNAPADTGGRFKEERARVAGFFEQSRKENTLFYIGFTYGGLSLPVENKPDFQRQVLQGFSFGVDQRFLPAWALHASVGWAAQTKSAIRLPFSTGWLSTISVNYYPNIRRELRAGRSVNNIRNQLYLTAAYWQPLHNYATITVGGMPQAIKPYPFSQTIVVGYGINSRKNRVAYYNAVVGAGYLINRDEWVRHPIQLVGRIEFGFGF